MGDFHVAYAHRPDGPGGQGADTLRRALTISVIAGALALAACGGNDDGQQEATEASAEAGDTTVTEPTTVDVTVRSTAKVGGGFGCVESTSRSGTGIAAGARVTVEGDDQTLGTGTFQVTPDVDVCDWTAEIGPVTPAGFYRVSVDTELATLSAAELADRDGVITVHLSVDGSVILANDAELPDPAGFLDHVQSRLSFGDPQNGPSSLLGVGLEACAEADISEARGQDAKAGLSSLYASWLEASGNAAAIELRAVGIYLCPQHSDLVGEIIGA